MTYMTIYVLKIYKTLIKPQPAVDSLREAPIHTEVTFCKMSSSPFKGSNLGPLCACGLLLLNKMPTFTGQKGKTNMKQIMKKPSSFR